MTRLAMEAARDAIAEIIPDSPNHDTELTLEVARLIDRHFAGLVEAAEEARVVCESAMQIGNCAAAAEFRLRAELEKVR